MVSPAARKRLERKIYSEADHALWTKHGFSEIYLHRLGKSDWSELGKILNHPVMRVALECCLVARISSEELEQMLPPVYHLGCSAETIKLYTKYFFDIENMVKSDWQSYLSIISADRYSYTRIFAALTKGRDEVMHLVGMPTKVQFSTMLKNIMNTAHYKFEHYSRLQGDEAQAEARAWGKMMIAAGEKHEKFGATDATDFARFVQTEFTYIDQSIETITPEMIADIKPQLNAAQKPEDKDPKAKPPKRD